MQEDNDFVILREFLSTENRRSASYQLCKLLKAAKEKDENEYQSVWLPYCEEHTKSEPIVKEVSSFKEFEEWFEIIPFALFELGFQSQNHGFDICTSIVEFPHLEHVYSINLFGNSIGEKRTSFSIALSLNELP